MTDCIFCQILARQAPASFVHEDDLCAAFMDTSPVNQGHALLVPKTHFVTMDDCDEETAKHLAIVLRRLNKAIRSATGCEGILNEIMNGEAAGQEVFHLHIHIIPRNKSDGFGWQYPKGYGEHVPRELLDGVAAKIRASG